MKTFILTAIFLTAIQSQADIISCSFTEPFFNTTYSMAQQSLTITGFDESGPQVIKNVSFQIKGPAQFELVAKDGKILQKLDLNFKGSNGMSDHEYPYDVQWTTDANTTLFGGC